jgi:hypothetical protein
MNLQNRLDLEATSCVNHEIGLFNRKLCKPIEVFNHVRTFEMNLVRDHYTTYGLHLNTKGKDY